MASHVFRKPMTLERRSVEVGTDRRPTDGFSTAEQVLGATRHRLDDRNNDAGDVIRQEQLVYLPAGVAIAPGDRLTFDGQQWIVVGFPFQAYSQRERAVHHQEVRVRAGAR